MFLAELFTSRPSLKIIKNEEDEFIASAMIDGRRFKYHAGVSDYRTETWDVQFSDEMGNEGITGKGSALEVLSNARKFIELLIKHKAPKIIEFSANLKSNSRAGVYTRMFTRDSFGYKMTFRDSNFERLFTLTLPNKKTR